MNGSFNVVLGQEKEFINTETAVANRLVVHEVRKVHDCCTKELFPK